MFTGINRKCSGNVFVLTLARKMDSDLHFEFFFIVSIKRIVLLGILLCMTSP